MWSTFLLQNPLTNICWNAENSGQWIASILGINSSGWHSPVKLWRYCYMGLESLRYRKKDMYWGVNVTKRLRTVSLQNHTVIVVSSFHCSNNLTARSTDMWVMPQSSSGLTTQTEARQWQHRMRILQWSYAAKRNKNNEVFISIMRRKESELQTIKVAWHFS